MSEIYGFLVNELHELVVFYRKDNSLIWRGKPNGLNVHSVYDVPESSDCLVLSDWRSSLGRNLFRTSITGDVVWQVSVPPATSMIGLSRGGDSYIRIHSIDSKFIKVNSGLCFFDTVDISNGKVINSFFVK